MLSIPRLVLIRRNKRIDPHRQRILLLRRGPRNRYDPLAPQSARANSSPKCPSPPMPTIPTRVPDPARLRSSSAAHAP